jgi:hypothetical protein
MEGIVVDQAAKRGRRHLRIAIAFVAALAWLGLLAIGVLVMVAIEVAPELWCDHPLHDSDYGEMSWSILPPGPMCTWSVENGNLVNDTRGPGPAFSLWLLSLVGSGAFTVWAIRNVLLADVREESTKPLNSD